MRTSLLIGAGLIVFTVAAQAGLTAAMDMSPDPAVKQTPTVAPPKKDAGPEMTTATFGDWIMRCQPVSDQPGRRACEIAQNIVVQGQAAPIAQLAFSRTAPNEPLYLTAVLPTNVTFPSAVRISIDERDDKPVDVAWKRCLPAGCFANIAMTDAILTRWRAQDGAGRLVFKNGTGQDSQLPISFRGLARALDWLNKEETGPAK
jgi:invasion protein IalB